MINHPQCDVFIVEDDVAQVEEMADFFTCGGLAVDVAHSGGVALRRIAALRPRVALLDYNLPDTTGTQLAQRIHTLLPETAMIMMSGRIEGLSERILGQLGITVFVNKPLPLSALRQAVMKLVRSGPVAHSPGGQHRGWLSTGVGGTRQ
jgi:DNA-binding response OmpR family regulator